MSPRKHALALALGLSTTTAMATLATGLSLPMLLGIFAASWLAGYAVAASLPRPRPDAWERASQTHRRRGRSSWVACPVSEGERTVSRGVGLAEGGEPAQALACFEDACRAEPESVAAWAQRAAALGSLERFDEALQCAERALRLDPGDIEAWYVMASLQAAMEDYEETLDYLVRILALDADHARSQDLARRVLRHMDPEDLGAWMSEQDGELRAILRPYRQT